jgi:hypothetical protein
MIYAAQYASEFFVNLQRSRHVATFSADNASIVTWILITPVHYVVVRAVTGTLELTIPRSGILRRAEGVSVKDREHLEEHDKILIVAERCPVSGKKPRK